MKSKLHELYSNIPASVDENDFGCNLKVNGFVGGFILFWFDLTSDICNGIYFNEGMTGTMGVEIMLIKPLTESITWFLYSGQEYCGKLQNNGLFYSIICLIFIL